MPAPAPSPKQMFQIKEKLLRPATTSHFQVWISPPEEVKSWLSSRGFNYNQNEELISLSCSDTSLPGSKLNTLDIVDDHTGVTEKHAYRKAYDNQIDFTFFVDHGDGTNNYNVIWFFENWMTYIANEDYNNGFEINNFNYRFRFPDGNTLGGGYRTDIFIQKFEKDFKGAPLEYKFLKAYPISINSIPVSYESSQLLKCTVTFTYTKYMINRGRSTSGSSPSETPQIPNQTNFPNYSQKAFGAQSKNPSIGFTKPLIANVEPYQTELNGIGEKKIQLPDSPTKPQKGSSAFGTGDTSFTLF